MSERYGLRCANVFHAGDGNLHPLILFDANNPAEVKRAEDFGAEILELSVEVGGTITGEHGVGVEKINEMCVQFSSDELTQFHSMKAAFDPTRNPKSWESSANTQSLRGVRKNAHSPWANASSRIGTILMPLVETLCERLTAREPVAVIGGNTRVFLGGPFDG